MIKTLEKQQRRGEHDKREWESWTKLESSQGPVQVGHMKCYNSYLRLFHRNCDNQISKKKRSKSDYLLFFI